MLDINLTTFSGSKFLVNFLSHNVPYESQHQCIGISASTSPCLRADLAPVAVCCVYIFIRIITNDLHLNIRSFISIDVSIKDRINALQNRILVEENWKLYQVKPVEKQNFHFCIIFLGEVTPATLEGLKQKLLGLKFEPFKVFYTGLGVFPNTNNPRIIWMGTDPEGREELTSLSKKLAESIRDFGFMPDKPFIPHVTLFRLKGTRLRLQNILKK